MRMTVGGAAILMITVAGCSGFGVRGGQPGQPIPTIDPNGPNLPNPAADPRRGQPGDDGGARPVPSSLPDAGGQRTVCRASGRPKGWLAVEYVEGGPSCSASADDPYPAMVIQQLAPLPIGTVLAVCTGQPVPGSWSRAPEDPSSVRQCPRSPRDKRTGPTVMFIRRIY